MYFCVSVKHQQFSIQINKATQMKHKIKITAYRITLTTIK
jgi:hypothetical protein